MFWQQYIKFAMYGRPGPTVHPCLGLSGTGRPLNQKMTMILVYRFGRLHYASLLWIDEEVVALIDIEGC